MRQFLRQHPHILTFGILQLFFSAPGQTFLIALYVIPIFNEFGVSNSLFAGIYSTATLSAALLLNPAGRLIDKYTIQTIIKAVTILMAIGCWFLASAHNLLILFIAFFILRLIGQGVFGLAASTLMVKQFDKNRGKALGIITLGFPISEVVYPSIAVFLLSTFDWRISYVLFGFSNILLMLPIQLYLLKHANIHKGEFRPGEAAINPQRLPGNPDKRIIRPRRDYALKEILKDSKFYLILLASCLPPMVVTGLFFHQITLFEANHWAIAFAAQGLAVYAVCKAIGSVWIGTVVDQHGPFIPFFILIFLLGIGTWLASMGGPSYMIFLYFSIIGAALGFSSPVSNVVWPYFYGTKHMGSIKGFVATFRNGITALGPLPIAMILDAGGSINMILKWMAVLIFVMSILPLIIWYLDKREIKKGIC